MIDGKNDGKVMDGVKRANKEGLYSDMDARMRWQKGKEDSRWWMQTDRQTGRVTRGRE